MILETDRLYLRELNQGDYGSLCNILQDENDENLLLNLISQEKGHVKV